MPSRRDKILLGYGGDAVYGSSMQAARTEFEPPALIAAYIISNAPAPPEYFTQVQIFHTRIFHFKSRIKSHA